MSETPRGRAIRREVEVPGTPEEVWAAIATGPGIAAWFVPAEIEERTGGRVAMRFGDVMETGRVTAWEPPRRFAYAAPEERERQLAYEWLVEARAGGTCVVRLVNSGFGPGEDWDDDYRAMSEGWAAHLELLRLHRIHFAGEPAAPVMAMGASRAGEPGAAWAELCGALGLRPGTAGERMVAAAPDAPALAGTVVAGGPTSRMLLLDAPARGIGVVAAERYRGIATQLYAYFHGADAAAAAARVGPEWDAWMAARFPVAEGAPAG